MPSLAHSVESRPGTRLGMNWRVWLSATLAALAFFIGADRLVTSLVKSSEVAAQAVDIETPETYLAKLDLVRDHPGRTIAAIGDSQIVGYTMAEHGDPLWRQHTLDRALETRLRTNPGTSDALVVNFGANGLLPADIELVARDVVNAGAAAIVFSVSLRSFSADFNKPNGEFARPWLSKTLCRDKPKSLPHRCDEEGVTGTVRRLLYKHWNLYRLSDLLQERFLGGGLSQSLVNLADYAHNNWVRSRQDEDVGYELLLMLRARSRFDTVSFSEEHRQAQALGRTLDMLRRSAVTTAVFYSTENPVQFPQIMDPRRAAASRLNLLAFIQSFASSRLTVLPPLDDLPVHDFLDFMHLDADGYRILADHLTPLLAGSIDSTDAASGHR
jgi:lysophospholipase L1-like esterase